MGQKKLWRWEVDFGRMGSLEGLFVAYQADVEKAVGQDCYFGEVLGKHSDISCEIELKQFTALTDDAGFIEMFERFECASGTNPLKTLAEE